MFDSLMYSDAPDAFAVLSAHEVLDAYTGSDCNVLRVYIIITYIYTLYVIHAMHDTKDDLRGYTIFFFHLEATARSEGWTTRPGDHVQQLPPVAHFHASQIIPCAGRVYEKQSGLSDVLHPNQRMTKEWTQGIGCSRRVSCLNTRRTLYTSLQNVDSIVQNNNTALAIATQCSAPALVFQALLGIFEISVLPMAAWTFWSPLKNITEYCMTRCCRMVSRWRTNLLPDFEPTCAMPSVKRIPSDWSAFLGVQFIASYYMDSQLVNLCVIHYYQLLLYHAIMLIRLPTILLIHHHQRSSVFWQGITCTADVFVQWSIRIPRLRSYTTVSDRLFEESNKPSVIVSRWVQICAEYDSYENKHLM